MASIVVKTKGGTSVSFANTPQAMDDLFLSTGVGGTGLSEDALGCVRLNVMGNDLGGNAKSLWSLDNDDGTDGLGIGTNPNGTTYNRDLLAQDAVGAVQYSALGAEIRITADGQVSYNAGSLPDEIKAELQHLGAGEYTEDTFTYAIRLGNGTLSWATATVRIDGKNDPVLISSGPQSGAATEIADLAAGENATTHSETGTITFTDIDDSDTHTASVTEQGTGYLGELTLDDSNIDTGNGGSVGWSFDVEDSALDHLQDGETVDQYYDVEISDGNGGTATVTVHITLTGAEDAVVITSEAQAGAVTERADGAADENDVMHVQSGAITYTDADTLDTHTADFDPQAGDYLGAFSLDDGTIDTGNGGTVGWSFSVDDADLDSLQDGEHLVQKYDVTIDDGHGSAKTETVTVDIHGTQDVAEISAVAGGDYSVTEDSVIDDTAGGTLLVSDADHDQSEFDADETGDHNGTYGTFHWDASTGEWTYDINNAAPGFDDLDDGETATDTLTVHSLDGSASYDIVVTVNGADEEPETPADPHGPTGIAFHLGQSGNELPHLGQFVATGDDSPTDTFNWSIASGADSHILVGADGTLIATGIAPGAYTFTVVATDPDAAASPSASATFRLLVGNTPTDDTMPSGTFTLSSTNNIEAGLGGEDSLTGSAGVDFILGGSADDVITGGASADELDGGNNNDRFVYLDVADSPLGGGDKIYGFDDGLTGSHDIIDLDAFNITASNVTVSASGGDTVIRADVAGSVDLEITLVGVTTTEADIHFIY